MTVKGGTSPACAVCKFQRRKCKSDCVLAPHFPSNQSKAFHNVHRLFGVSNIMKILKQLNTEEQKEEAMKSIKYESDMRQRYPVYGCAGIICQLRQQLSQSIEELNYAYAQLSVFREQLNNNNNNNNNNMQLSGNLMSSSYLQLGQPEPFMMMNQFMERNEYEDYHHILVDSFEPFMMNQFNSNVDDINGGQGKQLADDDEDSEEFNMYGDDRQSYIDTNKDVSESSSDSFSQAGSRMNHKGYDNDLKNAAARFSLTNNINCI